MMVIANIHSVNLSWHSQSTSEDMEASLDTDTPYWESTAQG